MSRSGYDDCCDFDWQLIMYRGQVANATRGKRGQLMFRELKAALESMPVKQLIEGKLELSGEVCALGALGQARGLDMSQLDPEDAQQVGNAFDIARQLAAEVMYENDEGIWSHPEEPEHRWHRMHRWVSSQIKEAK